MAGGPARLADPNAVTRHPLPQHHGCDWVVTCQGGDCRAGARELRVDLIRRETTQGSRVQLHGGHRLGVAGGGRASRRSARLQGRTTGNVPDADEMGPRALQFRWFCGVIRWARTQAARVASRTLRSYHSEAPWLAAIEATVSFSCCA